MTSQLQTDLELCEYQLLENGIHNFIIKGSSREHADALTHLLDQLYGAYTGSQATVRILSECVQGVLPLAYTMGEIKKLMDKYPHAAPTRTAIILLDSPMASIMDTFIRLLKIRQSKVRYYKPQQRDAAIAWLLAND